MTLSLIAKARMVSEMNDSVLPKTSVRCLTKAQAAEYLGIGVTLFETLGVPCIKFGRRCVYDLVDLDAWLVEYKGRGRAGKEVATWPVKPDSTGEKIRVAGGSIVSYPTVSEYEEVLGLKTEKKPKRS